MKKGVIADSDKCDSVWVVLTDSDEYFQCTYLLLNDAIIHLNTAFIITYNLIARYLRHLTPIIFHLISLPKLLSSIILNAHLFIHSSSNQLGNRALSVSLYGSISMTALLLTYGADIEAKGKVSTLLLFFHFYFISRYYFFHFPFHSLLHFDFLFPFLILSQVRKILPFLILPLFFFLSLHFTSSFHFFSISFSFFLLLSLHSSRSCCLFASKIGSKFELKGRIHPPDWSRVHQRCRENSIVNW